MSDPKLHDKLKHLEEWFAARKGSIVAFSGGIDSTLVLFLARKFQGKENAVGVISNSESLKKNDFEFARNFCHDFDIQLEVIKTLELADERYNRNPENRCYFCKEHLYHDLQLIRNKYADFEVISGTNYDDLGDYRPGLQAAAKYQILSPMVDCRVSKAEIRELARQLGLPNWDKPASPCLSSRIPYNQQVTREKLKQVEAAENFLNDLGFHEVRVRHYGSYGQIEVKHTDLDQLLLVETQVVDQLKSFGFGQVVIDREGLVSGKLNRVIQGINPTKTA